MNTNKKKFKGGAEKLRLKRNAELKASANDPKQKKLCFESKSITSTTSLILVSFTFVIYLNFLLHVVSIDIYLLMFIIPQLYNIYILNIS